MEVDPVAVSSGVHITPQSVGSRTFSTVRRGFQPDEVRQYLARVAEELTAAAAREVELRRALQEALSRAAHPEITEETLTAGLGEHAARLIGSARQTAGAITAEAERRSAALLHDAEVRAERLRQESEGLMARRIEEAETASTSIRQAAEAEVRAARETARAEAAAAVAGAQAHGREMVAEAKAVRERMLSDLTRRRRAVQVQIDQLRAGRERLLAAYEVVRRTLDEATRALEAAEPEARQAAEAVGRRAVESDLVLKPEPRDPAPPSLPRPSPPVPAPLAADLPAPSTEMPDGEAGPVRRVATLEPPRPPTLRPQSVAEAAPIRLRALAAVDSVVEADPVEADPVEPAPVEPAPVEPAPVEPAPVEPHSPDPPVAELATGQHPVVAPAPTRDVEDLFARIRQEVPVAPADPELAHVTDESVLTQRDQLLDPVETELTRALKRVLQDEQNEVLDRLRRTRSSATEAVLPGQPSQVGRYAAVAAPFLERAAAAGARRADDEEVDTAATAAAPARMAEELARDLVEPLRSRLELALSSGAGDEGGLFDTVSSIYRQWKVEHIEPAARHAAATAFAEGRFGATPDGAVLRWLVDDEGGRCPDCDDNALAGPVAKGEAFPTGQVHPPAHPGCRCLLVTSLP